MIISFPLEVGKVYSVTHTGGTTHGVLLSAKVEGSALILEIKTPNGVSIVKVALPRKL